MKRSQLTRRVPLPPPSAPMARYTELSRSPWSPAVPLLAARGEVKSAATERSGAVPSVTGPRTETGFSRKVKLQVRTRAGNGDPDEARCECCGIGLGRYGGQVQHIVARGMGGTSDPVLGTAANGALLCGTAQSGDHGLAESRDQEMRAKGFWLPQGTDPRAVPMMLASEHGSGVLVWRTEDGRYSFEAPEVAALCA
jgi:hypothetical protein